ncbi:hypothetical protein [Streptomyces sp. NPDC048277]|uniref:hypothetical protein n=1 Tax=Streptomyces sp. NPDC048277 TaxID=3155027 RepID=UPI0033F7B8B3
MRTGDDERDRGTRDAAPLRIDGRHGRREDIERLRPAVELTHDEFEDHFLDDVIVEDNGEGTDAGVLQPYSLVTAVTIRVWRRHSWVRASTVRSRNWRKPAPETGA